MAVSKRQIEDMAHDIANTIEHGECFYEDDDLLRLFYAITNLKQACADYAAECYEEESE